MNELKDYSILDCESIDDLPGRDVETLMATTIAIGNHTKVKLKTNKVAEEVYITIYASTVDSIPEVLDVYNTKEKAIDGHKAFVRLF